MTARYIDSSREAVQGTLAMFKYLRAFQRSDKVLCADVTRAQFSGYERLDKEQARRRLYWLLDTAINRKAGDFESEIVTNKDIAWRRDQRAIHDYLQRRILPGGLRFESKEARQRFGWITDHAEEVRRDH